MRYYGGKEKLLEFIESEVRNLELPKTPVFCDLFSGTAVVGRHFKKCGFNVITNDYLHFAKCLATARVKLSVAPKFEGISVDPFEYLNEMEPKSGFFSSSYSPDGPELRQYFSSLNARRIQAIREQIHLWHTAAQISNDEHDFLITALLEAMNRTSNVSGTYAAYLKTWDPRALKDLRLEIPKVTPGHGTYEVHNSDAVELAGKIKSDVLYLDPPYNSRQYSSNYFLLDVVSTGWFEEVPEVRGITGMRDNSRFKSDFCSKKHAPEALGEIINSANSRYIVLSYNNEGIISLDQIVTILERHGGLKISQLPHRRYKAINHDPNQKTTTEYLFVLEKKRTGKNG